MRASLTAGIGKAFADLRQTADEQAKLARTERYMSSKDRFRLDRRNVCSDVPLYIQISGLILAGDSGRGGDASGGIFLRHSVGQSGRIYRLVEQSNLGLTLSTLLIAALLMVALGVSGTSGVAAVLGVAAVVCVSSAVAGELLQDFKVGYILGGTPRRFSPRN